MKEFATNLSGRRRLILIGVGVLVLALGWYWLGRAPARLAPSVPPAVAVETAMSTRHDVPVYLEGLGNVQPFYAAKITARVDGQLEKVPFEEGQQVKKGDLLAQIDPRPLQAALDAAVGTQAKDTAQLESAKRDLDRYVKLAPQNLTSSQVLDAQRALVDQLQAQLKIDQAAIDNARTQLQYASITAPFAGRVGIRLVDPGNIVHASDTGGIVLLTQVQPIAVLFTLPEDAVSTINQALSAGAVNVVALSRDGKTTLDSGKLALVDDQIDPATATIKVKAIFPNERNALWPGEFVNVRVLVRQLHGVVTVPSAAVQNGPNGPFAYVVKSDATVEARPITIGEDTDGVQVVTAGLTDGEQVVTSNQFRLQPGAHVRILAASNAPASNAPVSPQASSPADAAPVVSQAPELAKRAAP